MKWVKTLDGSRTSKLLVSSNVLTCAVSSRTVGSGEEEAGWVGEIEN
jgi:hypothetical protein